MTIMQTPESAMDKKNTRWFYPHMQTECKDDVHK